METDRYLNEVEFRILKIPSVLSSLNNFDEL